MNLLRDLPARRDGGRDGEIVEILAAGRSARIERIVSHGESSPDGFWYDQDEVEFVVLLAGAARLRFADETDARTLAPGDTIEIAAHRRHRVDWTDPAHATVWLAVFYSGGE